MHFDIIEKEFFSSVGIEVHHMLGGDDAQGFEEVLSQPTSVGTNGGDKFQKKTWR